MRFVSESRSLYELKSLSLCLSLSIHVYRYIYIYIDMYVCICMNALIGIMGIIYKIILEGHFQQF